LPENDEGGAFVPTRTRVEPAKATFKHLTLALAFVTVGSQVKIKKSSGRLSSAQHGVKVAFWTARRALEELQ
jgi:hypothetical protein